MFLTLLTTELKTQDPTAPEDPTTMVDQLVQFNSLNQLISINGNMGTLVTDVAPTATSTTSTGTN
jgi:flagellar basal-body rod modification protein FlgD